MYYRRKIVSKLISASAAVLIAAQSLCFAASADMGGVCTATALNVRSGAGASYSRVSLVLINNEKGEKVFDLIKKDLIYQTSTVEKCMMSTMQRPFSKPEDREEFWDSYLKKDFDFMAKKYGKYGLLNAFKRSFKFGIGRVYRRIRKY